MKIKHTATCWSAVVSWSRRILPMSLSKAIESSYNKYI